MILEVYVLLLLQMFYLVVESTDILFSGKCLVNDSSIIVLLRFSISSQHSLRKVYAFWNSWIVLSYKVSSFIVTSSNPLCFCDVRCHVSFSSLTFHIWSFSFILTLAKGEPYLSFWKNQLFICVCSFIILFH